MEERTKASPPRATPSDAWRFAAFQTAPASHELEGDFLAILGTLGSQTAHPAGPEMRRIAHTNGHPVCPTIGFQDFPGRGFGGAVQLPGEAAPRAVLVGTREFMAEAGLQMPALLEVAARQWEAEGALVLLGGWDGYVRGVLKFQP